MSERLERKIDKLTDLVREQQNILDRLDRSRRRVRFINLVKWSVIILITAATYYYISPLFQKANDLYENVQDTTGTINNVLQFAE
jgi:hypothetical protein